MPRQRAAQQVNQFIAGLNTEANPLSFPPNASFDEQNAEINNDGGRSRRLGFDVEGGHVVQPVPVSLSNIDSFATSQYSWTNPGGTTNSEFIVVQFGNYLAIHNANTTPISSDPSYSYTFPESVAQTTFNYAVVDGVLVIATGLKQIYLVEFNIDGSFTISERTLLVRDFFGLDVTIDDVNLTESQTLDNRPTRITAKHIYNLRNQTFALPRVRHDENTTEQKDPISNFNGVEVNTNNQYPSNADNLNSFLFADAERSRDRLVERFFANVMYSTPPENTKAPTGYFVIDAIERGVSRLEQIQALQKEYPALELKVQNLPKDYTSGGATVLSQYAGRIWYAGFSGEVIDGDAKSPRLSSYVLFSQLVNDVSDIGRCHQAADPTSNIDSDLVSTDGGFIKLDGAYNIRAMVNTGNSLFVLAENGIWSITGIENDTFTATQYSVTKLSDDGCISGKSAVVSVNSIAYWGSDAIHGIQRGQTGLWEVVNLTKDTIQTFYQNLTTKQKTDSVGYYDEENLTIRWIYNDGISDLEFSEELILNLRFSSFTKNKIMLSGGVQSIVAGTSIQLVNGSVLSLVTSEDENVYVGNEIVTVPLSVINRDTTESYYLVLLGDEDNVRYTFGRYNSLNTTNDWTTLGSPVDSPAFILTGTVTGGDARVKKDVPYLTVYLKEDDLSQELPETSCIITARWDWSNNVNTGKWTSPRQTYRTSRLNNPGGVLSSRNKVRGSGKTVAFKFESEPEKGFTIYGWEFNLTANNEE